MMFVSMLGAAVLSAAPAVAAQQEDAAIDSPAAPTKGEASNATELPAPPKMHGFALSLDVFVFRRYEKGYALFADSEEQSAAGLSARYDLVRLRDRGVLAVGLGIAGEADTNPPRGGDLTKAELRATSYYATATFRWAQGAHLAPYLTVAGGLTHGRLRLTPQLGEAFEDHSFSGFGRAGLGLRVITSPLKLGGLPNSPFALACALEAGGSLGSPLSFQLKPAREDDDGILSESVRLGQLEQLRTYLRIELALVF